MSGISWSATDEFREALGEYVHALRGDGLEGALADLQASSEITVGTAPHYVLGYLCQELAAKWVVTGDALTRGR